MNRCPACGCYRDTPNHKLGCEAMGDFPGERLPTQETSQTGEVRVTSPTGGQKGSKPAQLHWIDQTSLLTVAGVAGMGARKYANDAGEPDGYNFRKGYAWSLSYDALMRHLMAFWEGEDMDPESTLPHVAHAAWHCLTLLTFMTRELGKDDRPKRLP